MRSKLVKYFQLRKQAREIKVHLVSVFELEKKRFNLVTGYRFSRKN